MSLNNHKDDIQINVSVEKNCSLMRSQLCVKTLLLPYECQSTPHYCNTAEINGETGTLECKFGIDTHFTVTSHSVL